MNMTNGKKVSQKRKSKAKWMWLEQIFYKIDDISDRLKKVESDIVELRNLYIELRNQINRSDSNDNQR
ncbi:MAG: hypothetical protein ACUVT3_13120 [Ignavibacterium sp.]